MAYSDELLEFARELASLHPNEAHQPSLRRALSTAYYALFHLLISDATASCTDLRFRAGLARIFEHGIMKQASEKKMSELSSFFLQKQPVGHERAVKFHRYTVAETFSLAQHNRQEADYNLAITWQPTEVSLLIEEVDAAFASWALIRNEPAARDYLLSMLPSKEKKQPERPRVDKRPTLNAPPPKP